MKLISNAISKILFLSDTKRPKNRPADLSGKLPRPLGEGEGTTVPTMARVWCKWVVCDFVCFADLTKMESNSCQIILSYLYFILPNINID